MHHMSLFLQFKVISLSRPQSMKDLKSSGLSLLDVTVTLDDVPETATSAHFHWEHVRSNPKNQYKWGDTARQTPHNHIEGKDSTTYLESESQPTSHYQLFPPGELSLRSNPKKIQLN